MNSELIERIEFFKYFKNRKKKYSSVMNDLTPDYFKLTVKTISERLNCNDLYFVNFLVKDALDDNYSFFNVESDYKPLNFDRDMLKVDYFYNRIESAVMRNIDGSTLSELAVEVLDDIKSLVRAYI